jgi:hypothetical protein
MATREQALADFKTAVAAEPLRIQIEVVQRVKQAIEEAQADQREQRITTAVAAAQALATYSDLRPKDLDDFLQELQDAFE